ncbi:FliM/FliN family flagellar motor switch protein [Undibacterium umbellatum]|uniref:FliM/FliN family flagellar motor switch protein n=1 Tax=Undibacterium umbellatum TaxID=2762300 RepID=A0ABR6ZHB2_9BURK|nr:FliM/FliN family flagellar motor C-terminal domain-containing protein [Undibacterium umbellatum]MBC3911118.1 FliM/FliN family flagellar motor switch protein [Undibacterium umbellatum]
MSEVNAKPQILSSGAVHKMRWWVAAQLDLISKKIDMVNADWSKDWLATGESHSVLASLASASTKKQETSAGWRQVSGEGAQVFWMQTPPRHLEHLQDALFSASESAPVSSKSRGATGKHVASLAWEEYLSKLTELLSRAKAEMTAGTPPQNLYKSWSGAVQLEIQWCGVKMVLVLNQACVEQLLGTDGLAEDENKRKLTRKVPSSKLQSIVQAVQDKKIRIRVELSPCDIELGNLQHIQVGDVIPLPHGLEQPLQVRFANGDALCLAFLGRRSNKKAIEVLAPSSATKT